jgi:hypothetical protein
MAGSKPSVVIATSKHKQSMFYRMHDQGTTVPASTTCDRCDRLLQEVYRAAFTAAVAAAVKVSMFIAVVRLLSHPLLNCWVMPSKEHPATADVLNAAVLAW